MTRQSGTYRVIEIIQMMTDYLQKYQIENARLNAELLTSHVLNMNRVQLYLNFEKPLRTSEIDQLRALLKRRAEHEPLQYLLGEVEFYSLKFKVTPQTLIPRPETEILVEKVIEFCQSCFSEKENIDILDVGTGSGNIAVALAKNLRNCTVTGIDVSAEALKVAEKNAEINDVAEKIHFLQCDFLKNIPNTFPQFDVVVSNPPYISELEFELLSEEVLRFEPKIALSGGNDGLKFYRRISEVVDTLLKKEGLIALEIGANQAESVKEILSATGFLHQLEVMPDLNKLPRVIIGKRKS